MALLILAIAPLAAEPADEEARIAAVSQPTRDFSRAQPYERRPAGAATVFKRINRDAFSHPSANMAFKRERDFRVGNGIFRKIWVSAPSSTTPSDGLGPLFNARACQRCHLKDGRGRPPAAGERAETMLMRLSIPPQTETERTVAFAMQYEGPVGDLVPLVGVQQCGCGLRLLQAPRPVLRAMKNYCGSVCFDPSGRTIAASAPRGGLVTFWDVGAGRHLSSTGVPDGCGVAPGSRPDEFLASSGQGSVVVVDARSGSSRRLPHDGFETARWDNHLVAAQVSRRAPGTG